jgi:uncharacterized protein DUF1638
MVDHLNDTELTENGLNAPTGKTPGRVLLLACGALAREVLALISANGWDHMDLTCLPANLHLFPDKITDAVAQAVEKHRSNYANIFVLYADCGTGGLLKAKCDELGVQMLAGPHCYSFYEGNINFAAHDDEITAFYLTDFLVRQFDAFIWKPMGLDRHPELRDMYFGNYTKLVYQAQVEDAALKKRAQSYAARLGLAFEYRFTGYGDLAAELKAHAS